MILIKKYKKNIYVARGNTTPYRAEFKNLGFRWSKKLEGGPGYTIRLYNVKHLQRIYKKLRFLTNDDVCLLEVDSDYSKKRTISNVDSPNSFECPRKKVCTASLLSNDDTCTTFLSNDSINDDDDEDINLDNYTWRDVVSSFPVQIAFVSVYFNVMYPQFIKPGILYLMSTDFQEFLAGFTANIAETAMISLRNITSPFY